MKYVITYTRHKLQKRKVWEDGFLRANGRSVGDYKFYRD